MKLILLPLFALIVLSIGPILSHGFTENCSEECNDYYCPSQHQLNKKVKVKNNIPSKK